MSSGLFKMCTTKYSFTNHRFNMCINRTWYEISNKFRSAIKRN